MDKIAEWLSNDVKWTFKSTFIKWIKLTHSLPTIKLSFPQHTSSAQIVLSSVPNTNVYLLTRAAVQKLTLLSLSDLTWWCKNTSLRSQLFSSLKAIYFTRAVPNQSLTCTDLTHYESQRSTNVWMSNKTRRCSRSILTSSLKTSQRHPP